MKIPIDKFDKAFEAMNARKEADLGVKPEYSPDAHRIGTKLYNSELPQGAADTATYLNAKGFSTHVQREEVRQAVQLVVVPASDHKESGAAIVKNPRAWTLDVSVDAMYQTVYFSVETPDDKREFAQKGEIGLLDAMMHPETFFEKFVELLTQGI